jgi:hypothetical protein
MQPQHMAATQMPDQAISMNPDVPETGSGSLHLAGFGRRFDAKSFHAHEIRIPVNTEKVWNGSNARLQQSDEPPRRRLRGYTLRASSAASPM